MCDLDAAGHAKNLNETCEDVGEWQEEHCTSSFNEHVRQIFSCVLAQLDEPAVG